MPMKTARWLALFLLLMSIGPAVQAQGVNTITYGSIVTGTLSAESPLALYIVNGTPGDLLTARLVMVTPGAAPTLGLLGPAQQSLATGETDVFSGTGVSLGARLQTAGPHTLIVGGAQGDYILMVNGQPALGALPLFPNQPADIVIPPEGAAQTYSIDSSAGSPLSVQIIAGTSGFAASLYSPEGRQLAAVNNGVNAACLTVPGNVGAYTVAVASPNPAVEARFSLALTTGACAPGAGSTTTLPQSPVATEEVSSSAPIGSSSGSGSGVGTSITGGACVARSATNVNIRNGPGQQYGIIGTLFAGTDIPVTGRTADGWYRVSGNNIAEGWVASSVASLSGDCGGIPTVQGPAQGGQPPAATATPPAQPGQPNPTATYTYTPTQDQPLQAESTYTATALADQVAPTATYTYTPTYTPTDAPQEAPPDSNYSLNVQLDGNASLTEFVSYPGGDTEDVVSYAVNGLNQSVALPGGQANLSISFSCFGTGTQYITFIADGQSFSCGQTFTRVVNADSRTGAVRIRATGGEGTYVQWALTANAPRVN